MAFKLELQQESAFQTTVIQCPAKVDDILDKLCVLHTAGACPTEIVGLSADGKYLIAKQPKCRQFVDFASDKKIAARAVNAVVPKGSYGMELRVFFADDRAWCLGDLH